MQIRILYILLILPFIGLQASEKDSLNINHKPIAPFLKKQFIPVGFISAGILLNSGTIKEDIQHFMPDTNTKTDDYLQYAPMAQMYLFDLIGLKHRNTVFDQTKYLGLSQLSTSVIVHILKPLAGVRRPGGTEKSFPSGHTSMAFVGATVLFHEFKESEPFLACSGFVFATATGFLRITNNKHWLPDVLAGAGIGILCTNMIYHLEPLKNWQPFNSKKKLILTPMISANSFSLVCNF